MLGEHLDQLTEDAPTIGRAQKPKPRSPQRIRHPAEVRRAFFGSAIVKSAERVGSGTTKTTMERREEETPMHPSEELEHLALAARLSGVDVEIVLPESKEVTREGMRLHYLDWDTPPQQAKPGLAG